MCGQSHLHHLTRHTRRRRRLPTSGPRWLQSWDASKPPEFLSGTRDAAASSNGATIMLECVRRNADTRGQLTKAARGEPLVCIEMCAIVALIPDSYLGTRIPPSPTHAAWRLH